MPMLHKQKELKAIYIALMLLFVVFLFTPVALLFAQSFQNEQGITFSHYTGLLQDKIFWKAFFNSVMVSGCAALSTTILAFLLGYTIHFTNLKSVWKSKYVISQPCLCYFQPSPMALRLFIHLENKAYSQSYLAYSYLIFMGSVAY